MAIFSTSATLKRIFKSAVAGLIAMVSFPQPGSSQFYSGNDILRFCTASNAVDQAVCGGYIVGVSDGSVLLTGPTIICIPAGVTVKQLKDIVIAYLQRVPELRHLAAGGSVGTALFQAFPCKG